MKDEKHTNLDLLWVVWNCRVVKVWVVCFCLLLLAFLFLPADREDWLQGHLAPIALPFIADALRNTNYCTAPLACCAGLPSLCQRACGASDSKLGPTRSNSVHAAPSLPPRPPTELPRLRFSLFFFNSSSCLCCLGWHFFKGRVYPKQILPLVTHHFVEKGCGDIFYPVQPLRSCKNMK